MVDPSIDERGEIRDEWRGIGTQDIEDKTLNTLGEELYMLVTELLETFSDDEPIEISEIIICGSYERNEAIKHFSDLDIRIVVNHIPDQSKEIRDKITEEYSAESKVFGYIDAQFHTESLPESYTRLWEKIDI